MYWKTREIIRSAFYLSKNILNNLADYLESQVKYVVYLDGNHKVDDIINIDEIQKYFNGEIKKVRKQLIILTEEFTDMREEE